MIAGNPGFTKCPFGITARELLDMAEADNPGAMLIGGPCRQMIGPERFGGQICYDDLATGGAILIFNRARNKLEIAEHYLDFFIEESCGHCTPCRVGLVLLKKAVHKVVSGAGEPADLDYMRRLANVIIQTSRCGLGQAAPNPVLGALQNFHAYTRPGGRAEIRAAFDFRPVQGGGRCRVARRPNVAVRVNREANDERSQVHD